MLQIVIDNLQINDCEYCIERGMSHADDIDVKWKSQTNQGYWPKPYQEGGVDPLRVRGIVIGQDPTVQKYRPIVYVLEADHTEGQLGRFLREVFSLLPDISFNELYFTNLVKCRFKEKPGKDGRNISDFLSELASNCYLRFLQHEIDLMENARYIFTLGRDTFNLLSNLVNVRHKPLTEFANYYGEKLVIPTAATKYKRYLVPLPHQPTYELGRRYERYGPTAMSNKLKVLLDNDY